MNTQSVQLDQTTNDEDRGDFASSIEYDHPIHTLLFGNRMCGKLEIVSSLTHQTMVLEMSDAASNEVEIKEGRGTLGFTKRTSPYSLFRQDNAEDRHDVLIRAFVPQNTLRRVCARTRLASVSIRDYEAEEFSVNASLGGSVFLTNISCTSFKYEAVSGACTIRGESIDVENLRGVAYSSGHVLLSGKSVNHRLTSMKRAVVDLRELESERANISSFHASRVHLGNVGSLTVQARNKARVFVSKTVSIDADDISKGHFVV